MSMANDGDRNRVAAFFSNGGGVVTFRVVLTACGALTIWLLQMFGNQIVASQDKFARAQERMSTTLATLAQQTTDTSALATRDSLRLDDHEHRITILEVRSGH